MSDRLDARGVPVDPVTFEVIRHRLWTINDEQGMMAAQLSGSPVVYEALDMNTGLLTPAGEQLFTGVYILTHAADLQIFIEHVLAQWAAEDIHEGDMFFTNDPAAGAIHANDGILATPIFWKGAIVCWAAIAMHDPDVGSPVPGSFVVGARDRFGEAPLFSPMKLIERFRLREDIARAVMRNHRTPEQTELHMRARIAALEITHQRVHELIREYGVDVLLATQQEILAYVERVVRRRLGEIPDGSWYDQVYIDHDGNENILYPIRCRLTKAGDSLVADFSGTAPQATGPINCARSGLEGGLYAMFLIFLCHDLPWAAGAARRIIEIISDEGTVNNAIGAAPTSMASIMGCLGTVQVAHAVFAKMLLSAPSETLRSEAHSPWIPFINASVLAGIDDEGEQFVYPMLEDYGGGAGARTFADGIDCSGHVTALASMIGNVEVTEERIPIMFLYRREGIDTGGAGRFRGGVGLEVAFTPHKSPAPITDIITSAGRNHPAAHGLAGGYPAPVHANFILRSTNLTDILGGGRMPTSEAELAYERREELAAKQTTLLQPRDVHMFLITGGGGYGDPARRAPERVTADVRQGLVSEAAAREIYGVVIRDRELDSVATAAAREALLRDRLGRGRQRSSGEPGLTIDGGRVLHPVTDTIEAVQSGGEAHLRCAVCHWRFGAYTDDFRGRSLVCERPVAELSPLNASPLIDQVVAREFTCPQCGTLIGIDIQRPDEPLLVEAVLRPKHQSHL